jgi:hypothetical protein
MNRGLVAGALAAALLAPAVARADATPATAAPAATATATAAAAAAPAAAPAPAPPDPAALEAGEANLESTALRRDVILTLGLGGAFSIGLGMDNATGSGGALTLRLAHVANARAVFSAELVGSALFFKVLDSLYQTNVQSFLLSGQYYVNEALWLRAGLGLGRYGADDHRVGELVVRERFRLAGPAGSAGAGVDIVRLKRFRASLELCSTAMLNSKGVLLSNAILLGFSVD